MLVEMGEELILDGGAPGCADVLLSSHTLVSGAGELNRCISWAVAMCSRSGASAVGSGDLPLETLPEYAPSVCANLTTQHPSSRFDSSNSRATETNCKENNKQKYREAQLEFEARFNGKNTVYVLLDMHVTI